MGTGAELPDPVTVKAYAENVADDFSFAIKAPNAITLTHFYARHPKRYTDYAKRPDPHFLSTEMANRFLETLSPMKVKFGPVMLQLEYLNG